MFSMFFFGGILVRPEPSGLRSQKTLKIKNTHVFTWVFFILVALVGLEPTLLAELDFESSASTNSATGPKPWTYFAAAFLASTFLTKRALRVGLCTGFLAGAAALPCFFSMARLIAAISSVKRDTGFAIT